MSQLLEQLAKELGAFAVSELVQLPPAPPPPKPAAPAAKPAAGATPAAAAGAAPKPATPAVAKPAAVAPAPAVSAAPAVAAPKPAAALTGASQSPSVAPAKEGAAAATPKPAAPAAPATPPPPPPKPVQVWDFAQKGIHLEVTITPDKVVEAAQVLDRAGFAIDAVTGMDYLAPGLMEVVYDFLHFQSGERVVFRARIPRAEPRIATISDIFPGANWHERETHDMYGIVFIGHPCLEPFLLPDDADFHPLRKDFNP